MSFNVFYSWQSDSPNKYNRSFIEDCLKKAVKDLKKDIELEIVIDRDTKGITGTPDITKSIFDKIDKANVFVADVTIINNDYSGRKTPNPNVLFELGYASCRIDWRNIICVVNTAYGNIEDLPFDIKFRRPISYKLGDDADKSTVKKNLIALLKISLVESIIQKSSSDEIVDYIKYQVDTEILRICNSIFKLLHGYSIPYTFDSIRKILSYNNDNVQYELYEKKFLGFTLLRDWSEHYTDLNNILNQPFVTQKTTSEMQNAMISILKSLDSLVVISSKDNFFEQVSEERLEGYRIIHGRDFNSNNPENKYLLMKEVDDEHAVVLDSAYLKKYSLSLAPMLLRINNQWVKRYIEVITQLLNGANKWLDCTNGEFIVDEKMFKFQFNNPK